MTSKAKIAAAVKDFKAIVSRDGGWFAEQAYEKGLRDGIAMVKPPKADPFAADNIALPDWLPAQAWADWCDHRRAIKLPMTARAGELQLKHLTKLRDAGNDPVEVIEQSVRGGKWENLYALKDSGGVVAGRVNVSSTAKFGARTGGKSWREANNDAAEQAFLERTKGAPDAFEG